jgi:hypothetical protein
MEKENKIIEVCDKCFQASCWYGEFMCCEADVAGTVKKTIKQLRKIKTGEHEDYWSDNKMKEIYGEEAPFGYKS